MVKLFKYWLLTVLAMSLFSCTEKPEQGAAKELSVDSSSTVVEALGATKPKPPMVIEDMDKQQREAYKTDLKTQGFYRCCVHPACTMCLYDMGECFCEVALKKKDPVCGECYRGWQKGKGAVGGVNPKQVKRLY